MRVLEAVAWYEAGLTVRQVGAWLGVSGAWAHQMLVGAGVQMRPPGVAPGTRQRAPRQVSAATLAARAQRDARICELYLEGLTGRGVSEQLGVCQVVVWQALRHAGIARRPGGSYPRVPGRKRAPAYDRAVAVAREQPGLPYREIARQAGCSVASVANALRRAGMARRPRPQPEQP